MARLVEVDQTLSLSHVMYPTVDNKKDSDRDICGIDDTPSTPPTQLPTSTTYEDYVYNNLRKLTEDAHLSDVTFVVQGERLYGVRALFAVNSIVFQKMLYNGMMESQRDAVISLDDITVPAFLFLRSTFYNIQTLLTADIVVDVMWAAEKYIIHDLKHKCIHFIKNITDLDDWFMVLHQFEKSCFSLQAQMYLNEIINMEPVPYILMYKSTKFAQHSKFRMLAKSTVRIIVDSDHLATTEDEIWNALVAWVRYSYRTLSTQSSEDEAESENELKSDSDHPTEQKQTEYEDMKDNKTIKPKKCELNDIQKQHMREFLPMIRFTSMDATFFKQQIVDKQMIPERDIIDIMFARENNEKWQSGYNDAKRLKSKTMSSFVLEEVCLSFEEISHLQVGELIDFRDLYGLFCPASVIDVDHAQHKIKVHYNSWGSTYDEWYMYLADAGDENARDGLIRPTQIQKNERIANYGSITNRGIKRECFRQQIDDYTGGKLMRKTLNHECWVKLPIWFWKKNESYISNKPLHMGKWLKAKLIGYKTAAKYSNHIKIGIYIDDDHYEYWLHPDNDGEVRPIRPPEEHGTTPQSRYK